jgi:XTP/dITP diphosphohydrolase
MSGPAARAGARGAPARPFDLVLATGNRGKRAELAELLAAHGLRLASLADFAGIDLPEEGDDYAENAAAKALAVARACGLPALGDDSGIEVAALGGAPGPRSARYGGPGLDDAGRSARLLAALDATGTADRSARFVCVAALARPDGSVTRAFGECRGTLLRAPRGRGGFGYDPVFQPEGHAVSMAELPAAEKNRISHRARALAALARELSSLARGQGERASR